jgi:hypothetical protein
MMDQESRKMLDEILAQEPAALTDADKAFLRARSSYLNEEQRSVYAEVLAEGQESASTEQTSEESEAEQPKARKARKASEESEA